MLIFKLFFKKMVIIDFLLCIKKPRNLLSSVWYFLSQNWLLGRYSFLLACFGWTCWKCEVCICRIIELEVMQLLSFQCEVNILPLLSGT